MYEQDPPYRKKVYDILSSNFEDFKTPEEEFYKKLDSDKGYAKKVYGVLSSNFQDFSRPEDEFVSMLMPPKDNPFENQGPRPTGQQPGNPTSFPGGTQSKPVQQTPQAKSIQKPLAPVFKNQGPEVSGPQPGSPTSFPGGESPRLSDLEQSISESIGINKLIDQNSKAQVTPGGLVPATYTLYPEQRVESERQAEKWNKLKKEQISKTAPFLKSLEDAYIESGEYKSDFTKDGIVDTYKLLRRSEDLSKTYGGGDAVKELIYNNLRKRAEYEQIKPEVNTEFEKLFKEKTGKDSKAFIQEKQAAQFAELSGLEKEIKNNFTLEQTRSKDIVNEKAKTIFQEKYAPGLQQALAQYGQDSDEFKTALDEAQTNAARDLKEVTVNENKRLLRIRNELNAKMKSSLKLAKENSSLTPEEEKQFDQVYGQAYEKVQERKYNTKAAKDFVSTMDATGKAGAFLKSLWSGLNNSAASIGSGLVSMGMNNVVTDWARGLETTAKEYEVTDQPLKGENLLDPTTYLTRTGKQIGGTLPIIAMTALTKNPYVGGAIGFGFETIQGMGDVYNQAKSEGQSEEEAQKSAENFRQRNSMLLPLYFVESMGILEGLKGGFKKSIYSTGLEMAGELGTEIPQNFFQQQDSKYAKSFDKYLKEDAGQIAIETAIGVVGQGAAVSSLGEMTKAIGSSIRSAEKQQALNIVDQAGINAAFAIIESQYQNGIIDEDTLINKKKALEQIQETVAGLEDMGVNQDGKKAYFEAVSQMSELNKKLQSTTDPVLRKIIEKQISEKQSEAQGIVDKTGTYAVITLPSGSSYSVLPSKVEETMNALKKQIGEGLVTVSVKGATEARGELTSKVNSLTKSYEESFNQQKQLQESKEEGIEPQVKQEEIRDHKVVDSNNEDATTEVTQEDPASQTETTPPGPAELSLAPVKIKQSQADSEDYSKLSDTDIENRLTELEGSVNGQKEFDYLEKEMERRERATVFNVPLDKATDAVDALIKKDKEQPNGWGSFIDRRDARETKDVIEKYSSPESLTDDEIKDDFKDALMGRPATWYADGMKLRESMKAAANRGINMSELTAKIKDEFIADYGEDKANEMLAYYLGPIFNGAKSEVQSNAAEQTYTTKSGKYTVQYNNGARVVVDKSGNEVNPTSSGAKEALKQHSENYNYDFGERVNEQDFPQGIQSEEEADRWVAENTQSPIEAAEVYMRNQPQPIKLNTKEQLIADFGGFVTTEQSYKRHGDANNINNAKARAYFRKDGMPLDVKAKEMSDHYGVEITEQDLVDYMDRFPNGTEVNKKFDNQARTAAKEKFEQLTGIPLTDKTANFALAQVATPEQTQAAEQDIFSMSDEDFYKEFYGAEDSTKNNEESGTSQEVQPNETGAAEGLTQNNEGQSDSQTSDEEDLKRLAELLKVPFEDNPQGQPQMEEAPFKLATKPGGFPEDFVDIDEIGITDEDNLSGVIDKMINYGGPFSDLLSLIKDLPAIKNAEFLLYRKGKNKIVDAYLFEKKFKNWTGLFFPKKHFGRNIVIIHPGRSTNPYYDFVHELMHLVTIDAIDNGRFDPAKLAKLEGIFEKIKSSKEAPNIFSYEVKNYGLINFKEFMAEILLNPEFRDHVKDVMSSEGTKFISNLLEAIKDFFAKLFGKVREQNQSIKKPMIDQAVDLMNEIFLNPSAKTERIKDGGYIINQIPAEALAIKGRANDIVKIVKKAQMAGRTNDEIRAAIKSIDPTMSDDIIDNILKNAEKMNIYRAMKPVSDNAVLPQLLPRTTKEPKAKTIIDKTGASVDRFFSSTGVLPKEVRKFFEHRDGEMQAEYRNLKKTLDEYNKLSKKYKFTEQDKANIDKALRDLKLFKRKLSSETGIVPFDAGVAAEGKMFTTPDDMLPAVIPDSLKALPEDVQELVIQMRAQIDALTKMAITSGFVTPEQALVLEENMGEYINRAYKLYSQKDWAEKLDPKVKEDARKYLAHEALGQILTLDPTMPLKDASDQAWKTAELRLNDILSKADVKTGISTSSNGRNTGILQRREDIPEPIRKLMGEYTDPAVSFAITVGKLTALNAHSKFLMNLRNFGMGTLFFEKNDELNRPADFNYQIAGEGSETWNPLNGLYTTKEIAESLKFNPESHSAFYNGYMKFVGGVRWGKTVLSPITQAKNFESNLGFAVMNGHFRVDQFVKSFQYFANSEQVSGLVDNLLKRGVLNQSVNLSELKSMLQDDTIHRLIRDAGNSKGSDFLVKVYDKLNKIYGASDNFWKIYTFMNEAEDIALIRHNKRYSELTADEKLTTDEEAAEITKNVTPTYGRAWDGAKALSKNAPLFGNFISFQIESVRTLGNTLNYIQKDLRDPNNRVKARGARRLAGVVLYSGIRYTTLSAIAQLTGIGISGLMGLGNSDDEDEMQKAYNRLNIPFLLSSDTYWKYNAPGEYTVYDVSSLEPYNVAFKFFNAYTNGSKFLKWDIKPGAAAAAAELLSPFIELEMSFDAFMQMYNNEDDRGKPIFHEEDDFGKIVYDMGDHIFSKLSPSAYGLAKRLITGDNPKNDLYGFVGLRGYDVNVRNVMSRKLREKGERILSVEGDFYTDQFNGDPLAAAELANNRIKYIATELHKDYKAVLLAGGDPSEIKKLIKGRGFKQGYQDDLKKAVLTGNIDRLNKYFKPSKAAIKKWNETQAR